MTRQEALQILDTIPTIGEQVDALEMAIEALESKDWIPCSERLPENDNDVLVQMPDYSMMVDSIAASSSGWFLSEKDDLPIAWQPLPEPYEEDE